jgi:hypothetical protein
MTTKSDQLKLALLAREGFQPLEELSRGVTLADPPSAPKAANLRIDHRSRWYWMPDAKLGFVLGMEVSRCFPAVWCGLCQAQGAWRRVVSGVSPASNR